MKLPENMQPLTPIEAVREPANYSGQCLLCGSPYEGTKAECKARKCRECIAREKQLGYVTEIAVIDEPAKDQPASGEGFVWMDESYPVATEAATQPPTGVEARVCGWQPIESAPGKPGWYLGSFDGALRCVGYDSAGWGFWDTPSDQRIEALTHWQPLPQPPEGGSEKP